MSLQLTTKTIDIGNPAGCTVITGNLLTLGFEEARKYTSWDSLVKGIPLANSYFLAVNAM